VIAAVADPRASYAVAGLGVLAVLALGVARLRATGWVGAAPATVSLGSRPPLAGRSDRETG
jgi:hypothetical protein